jgi:hypothetical protein
MPARIANIVVGTWLFFSIFILPSSASQGYNAMVCGVLAVGFAALAIAQPGARWLNTVLGAWVLISAWFLPNVSSAMMWNDFICGVLIITFSLIPSRRPTGVDSGFFKRQRREVQV